MSAELLRRAAKVLREHVGGATPGPWSRYGSKPYEVFTEVEWEDPDYVPPGITGGSDREGDAAYIILMHPPVALALAAWLEDVADSTPATADDWESVMVARAILRKSEVLS